MTTTPQAAQCTCPAFKCPIHSFSTITPPSAPPATLPLTPDAVKEARRNLWATISRYAKGRESSARALAAIDALVSMLPAVAGHELTTNAVASHESSNLRRNEPLPAVGAVAEPPLIGRWHHGQGHLVSGTIRISRWDCDTNPPVEFRDAMLDWICDVLNSAVKTWERAAADQFAASPPAPSAPQAEGLAVALPFAILDDEMAALRRYYETCEDSQPYDVSKDMMKRLAEIGLVRRVTAAIYEFTTFGLSVVNGDYAAPPAPTRAQPVRLSDVHIDAVTDEQWDEGSLPFQYLAHRAFARAIESEVLSANGLTIAAPSEPKGAPNE